MKKYLYHIRLLLLCLILFAVPVQADASDTTIHFLDVGQGLSVLIQSNNEVLIYDGGGRDSSSFVVAYLKSHNIDTIDYFISSHYDEDHVSGLIGCLNVFNINHVIASNYVYDSSLYESFMNKIEQKHLTIDYPSVGSNYPFGSGFFTILAPSEIVPDSNNNSIVIKLTFNNISLLLLGDAEIPIETAMLSSGYDLHSTIFCPAHHGSASSTSYELLSAASPEYAIISCGTNNRYGHPHQKTMDKLQEYGIPVFRTDLQGTILAETDGSSISWSVDPCNDYSSGRLFDNSDNVTIHADIPTGNDLEPSQTPSSSATYILNINSKKIHYPYCSSVNQMKDKNKQEYSGSIEDIILQGYSPCKNCNP